MKTIVLDQPEHLRLTDTPEPKALPGGEALVRVHRVGVCGTDYHAFRGKQPFFEYPRVLGHELGVEILEVEDNAFHLRKGDRCAVEPYLNCGTCIACRRGKTNCCTNMKVLGVHVDGGLREFMTVPARKLHKSDKLSLEQLALVETLGIGAHAVARSQVEPGEFALVVGAGPIGLSTMETARLAGAKVIALDVNPKRLDFCKQSIRVEYCVNAAGDPEKDLLEITGGDLPTVVFDCTGNPASMMKAFQYVAHGGKVVFVGLFPGDVTFHDPNFHRREITLFASRNAIRDDMQYIIHALEEGQIDSSAWITHRAPAAAMIEHFHRWLDPAEGVIKAVVEWT